MLAIVGPAEELACVRMVLSRFANGTTRTLTVTFGFTLWYAVAYRLYIAISEDEPWNRYEIVTELLACLALTWPLWLAASAAGATQRARADAATAGRTRRFFMVLPLPPRSTHRRAPAAPDIARGQPSARSHHNDLTSIRPYVLGPPWSDGWPCPVL